VRLDAEARPAEALIKSPRGREVQGYVSTDINVRSRPVHASVKISEQETLLLVLRRTVLRGFLIQIKETAIARVSKNARAFTERCVILDSLPEKLILYFFVVG
jgi:hypothetical protein